MSTTLKSLDQERAAFAWTRVHDVDPALLKDYCSLAKSAPSLIMTNGLMATLAFFRAKNKDHHKRLNQDCFQWLRLVFDQRLPEPTFGAVMNTLHGSDSGFYMQATQETLAILRWIRLFADARKGSR